MDALEQFSADLARLADLTDEELSALETNLMDAFDTADKGNDEAALGALADALDNVRTEIDRRAPADKAAPVAAPVAAAAETDEPETEAEAPAEATNEPSKEETEDATKKEEEDTPVTSSAQAQVEVPEDRAPVVITEPVNTIVAGGDLMGVNAGTPFKSLEQFSKAMAKRIDSLNRLTGGDGEKVVVASILSPVSDDRVLRANDPEGNKEKIEAITNIKALTAAGGCCAPLTTRYDLFTLGDTNRPVRDALAGFQADRGGIRFYTAPTLNDIGVATGIWSCADDEAYDAADDQTWKVCATVDCPPEQTAETGAVTMCLTFGVMSSRVFPENVTANTNLSLVQQARLAEAHLLAGIKAASTAVTGPAVRYGAVRDFLLVVARVGAWYRNRHRLTEDTPLRAIVPAWFIDILRADVVLQPPSASNRVDDFAISSAQVANFFDQWGINLTFTPDSSDGTVNGGGFYGPIVGTALPEFPNSMQWSIFAEGAFLFLDGGALDLGVVRDSTLVRANNYMQFSETFEGVAKVGGDALWVTSPIEPLGMYAGPITAVTNN